MILYILYSSVVNYNSFFDLIFERTHPLIAPNVTGIGCAPDSGYPADTYDHILRPADDPNFPWPGTVFGMIVNSIWYWCTGKDFHKIETN